MQISVTLIFRKNSLLNYIIAIYYYLRFFSNILKKIEILIVYKEMLARSYEYYGNMEYRVFFEEKVEEIFEEIVLNIT